MKKKCYLSLLLVLSMLIPTAIPVSAAVADAQILDGYVLDGWTTLVNPDAIDTVVGPTNFDAKTGDYSLCGIFPTKNLSTHDVHIKNSDQVVTFVAGTSYTVGIWVKSDVNVYKTWPYICVGDYNEKYDLSKKSTVEDGWTKYEETISPSNTITGILRLGFHSNLSGYASSGDTIKVLFDDAYMYAEGSDVNLIDNPSFNASVSQQEPETINVSSAQMIDNYVISGWSDLISPEDKGVRVGPTDDYARTGDYSLLAIFPTIKTYQDDHIQNTSQTVTVTAEKTYTFGVWLRYDEGINPRNTWPYICVGSYADAWDLEPGETVNGWRHYTKTFTPSANATGNLKFGFHSNMSAYSSLGASVKVLFDDAYLYEAGSNVNLVYNPSFDAEVDINSIQMLSGYEMSGWSSLVSPADKGVRVGPTDELARTGDYSLLAIFPTIKTWQQDYIQNTQLVTVKAGITYTFGVWLKYDASINPRNTWPYICVGSYTDAWDLEPGDKVNGWQHYTKTFTPSATYTGVLKFGFQSNMSAYSSSYASIKVLFDDAYMYAGGSDVNLIGNPSFNAQAAESSEAVNVASAKMHNYEMSGWSGLINNEDKGVRLGPTDSYARTGNYSLCVSFPTIKTYQHNYIKNTVQKVSVKAGKTYTFGVWLRYDDGINPRKTWPYICVGSYAEDWDLAPGDTVNGWQHYTKTFTPETNASGYLRFGFQSDMSEYSGLGASVKVLFDDAYLYEVDSNVNLVYNPGFEDCIVYGEEEPIRFVTYSAAKVNAGKAVVAWKNPARDDITAIALEVNDEPVEFTPDTSNLGYNEVVLTGLTDKAVYNCELKITAGGKTYTTTKAFTQNSGNEYYNAAGNRPLLDWRFKRVEDAGHYCKVNLDIDDTVKYSGNSSMRVTCGTVDTADGVYARLSQYVELEKNKSYSFSAKVKSVGLDDAIEVYVDNWTRLSAISSGNTWDTITGTIEPKDSEAEDGETYNTSIAFHICEGCDAAWIDDVELYELDGSDNPTGNNLIKNGGFEYGDWSVGGYTFNITMDGEILDEIEAIEEGEILGRASIFNFSKNDLCATVVSAIYEDGKLIDISYAEQDNMPITSNPFVPNQVGSSVSVPALDVEKTYQMKVFVWDSIINMQPLTKKIGVLAE